MAARLDAILHQLVTSFDDSICSVASSPESDCGCDSTSLFGSCDVESPFFNTTEDKDFISFLALDRGQESNVVICSHSLGFLIAGSTCSISFFLSLPSSS